eukprot:scaffold10813_cov65-Phaeocystis_antarctica.AAC.4
MASIGCQEAEMLGAWRVRRPRGQRGPDMRWHGDNRRVWRYRAFRHRPRRSREKVTFEPTAT